MQYIPIKYYLRDQVKDFSVTLDFQDARKGKLLEITTFDGMFVALIQQENGELTTTEASFVKIIGDDTKRTIARMVEEIKKMKDHYVPSPLQSQFVKDLENLKNYE